MASAVLFLVAAVVPNAWSDTFYTGRIDANGSVVAGGTDFAGAKQIDGAGGGFGHNNVFATGAGGVAASGDTIKSMGIIVMSGAAVGAGTGSFNTGDDLVAIYALHGTVSVDGMTGNITSNFDPGDNPGNHFGVIAFYDRSSIGGLLTANPSTWSSDLTSPLAVLELAARPDAVLQGGPGGSATAAPVVPDPGAINTQEIEVQAAVNTRGQYKADIVDLGTFLDNLDVQLPPDFFSTTALGSFFGDIIQRLDDGTNNTDGLVLSDLNNAYDDLFDLLGIDNGQFASGLDTAGSGYDPANFLTGNGDVLLLNNQFILNPGDQALPQQRGDTPEPASLVLWGLALVGSIGYGVARKRRQA